MINKILSTFSSKSDKSQKKNKNKKNKDNLEGNLIKTIKYKVGENEDLQALALNFNTTIVKI